MRKETILIADDEPDIRFLLVTILEKKAGVRVIEATDGECAIVLARDQRPDLVLLDVMMHGTVDGLDVARELRADPRTAQIPILMLSGRTWPDAHQAGLAQGADFYMNKPFNPDQLVDRIEILLQAGSRPLQEFPLSEAVLQ